MVTEGSVQAFWADFAAATGVDASYSAWAFGDERDPEQQTELGRLVRDGPKRATAGLLADYEAENEELPQVGDFSVILDGQGEPICIIRNTKVELRPFGEVDADFAWTEGEGDRTLDWWRQAHIRFFERRGTTIDAHTLLVLERFELVWPTGESD